MSLVRVPDDYHEFLDDYIMQEYIGRRLNGFFDVRTIDGAKVNNDSLSCKKINLICHNNVWFTERRESHSSST